MTPALAFAAFRSRPAAADILGHAHRLRSLGRAAGALVRGPRWNDDRVHEAAILFADIVGFSRLSETLPPQDVIAELRPFHARLAAAVRDHGGTVVNYMGDGMMAVFDKTRRRARDAADALRCALAMLRAVAAWNQERAAAGRPEIRIGIGLHRGPVASGRIGIEGLLQRAVVGDAVNVAKRLETATRQVGSPLLVSDDVVQAVAAGGAGAAGFLARLRRHELGAVRGRSRPISAWALAAPPRHEPAARRAPVETRAARTS